MGSDKMRLVMLATALAFGPGACDWLEDTPPQTPPPESADSDPAAAEGARLPPPSWSEALAAGIRPPAPGYATYDVDPFIAAVVVNAVRSRQLVTEPVQGGGQGFRLASFPPGVPHAALGLRTGDVVEAINDVAIQDVGSVIEALGSARNGLTLTIHREGVSFTLRYRLTQSLAWTDALLGIGADVPPVESGVLDPTVPPQPSVAGPVADRSPGSSRGRPSASDPPTGSSRPPTGSSKPTSRPSTPSEPTKPASVRCASTSQCEIDRVHFQALLANPRRLESQARIVPAIRNDIHSGYKLKSIQSGSDLARLGFRNEDKITHINGVDLTNEAAALALYSQAGASRMFRVRYERAGRAAQKTITVR